MRLQSAGFLTTNIRLSARSKAHAAAASLWIYWISGGAGHPLVTCCPPRINFCIGQWVIVHRSAHLARLRATCLHRQPRGEVALIVRCQIRWTVWIDRSELPSLSQLLWTCTLVRAGYTVRIEELYGGRRMDEIIFQCNYLLGERCTRILV